MNRIFVMIVIYINIGPLDVKVHSSHVAIASLRVETFRNAGARSPLPYLRRHYLRSQMLHASIFCLATFLALLAMLHCARLLAATFLARPASQRTPLVVLQGYNLVILFLGFTPPN